MWLQISVFLISLGIFPLRINAKYKLAQLKTDLMTT